METRLAFALALVTVIGLASCQATEHSARLAPLNDTNPSLVTRPVSTPAHGPEATGETELALHWNRDGDAVPAGAAQESEEVSAMITPEDEWTFVIAPYVWFLQLDGNSEVDDTVSRIDESFSDIWDQLNFVAEGRLEAWKGDWGALIDATYAKLENDADIGPVTVDIDTDVLIAFAGLLHNFIQRAPDENGVGGLRVDGFFGVAVTSIETHVEVPGGPDPHADESWVDPIVGMRSRFTFNERWGGSVQFDVGGFEVFDGSELTTMGTALVGRRFGNDKVLYFGWRSLFIDYSQDFDLDLAVNGPLLGFEWSF